ncbi:MAG: hypothetical protein MRJ65_15480 [Candidatus Brocadiaceae bacterium]|nr:hypothetical protein [Candidatus Brocadiaceae bacterium]
MIKKIYTNSMSNRILSKVSMTMLLSMVIGCATPTFYKNPISEYQLAVNKTISTIQPYFVELNSVETEYQLYSAIKLNQEWGTQHLSTGLDSQQIALRIKSLQLISDHARLLADIVNSSAPEDIKNAAKALGNNAQGLADTISKLNEEGSSSVPDFGTPLSEIVGFVGKSVIEQKQKEAIEIAVLDANKPISTLMEKLEEDLRTAVNLKKEAFAGIVTVRLDIFNTMRAQTNPEKIPDIINQIISLRANTDTIASVDVTALLREMKSTHSALVQFVKSDKTPTDISSFAERVDVFASNAKTIANIIESLSNL